MTRIEATSIEGRNFRVKLDGELVEYATMGDSELGIVEALVINPEYLSWLHNGNVPAELQRRYIPHMLLRARGEQFGTFPVCGVCPPRFLRIRVSGDIEFVPVDEDKQGT